MPHQCTNCSRMFADGSKEMLSGCPDCGGNKFQFKPKGRDEPQQSAAESSTPAASSGNGGPTASAADSSPDSPTDPAPSSAQSTPSTADANSAAGDVPDLAKQREDDEDNAQHDARSSFVSNTEIDEARRKMAEAEQERMAQVKQAETDDAAATDASSEASRQPAEPAPQTDAPDSGQQTPPTETDPSTEPGLRGAIGPADGGSTADDATTQPPTDPAPEETDAEELQREENPDLQALREELNNQFESIKITAPGQYELNLMELYDREEYIISLREDGRYVIEMPETWGASDR